MLDDDALRDVFSRAVKELGPPTFEGVVLQERLAIQERHGKNWGYPDFFYKCRTNGTGVKYIAVCWVPAIRVWFERPRFPRGLYWLRKHAFTFLSDFVEAEGLRIVSC
jgi:hypothetical protein